MLALIVGIAWLRRCQRRRGGRGAPRLPRRGLVLANDAPPAVWRRLQPGCDLSDRIRLPRRCHCVDHRHGPSTATQHLSIGPSPSSRTERRAAGYASNRGGADRNRSLRTQDDAASRIQRLRPSRVRASSFQCQRREIATFHILRVTARLQATADDRRALGGAPARGGHRSQCVLRLVAKLLRGSGVGAQGLVVWARDAIERPGNARPCCSAHVNFRAARSLPWHTGCVDISEDFRTPLSAVLQKSYRLKKIGLISHGIVKLATYIWSTSRIGARVQVHLPLVTMPVRRKPNEQRRKHFLWKTDVRRLATDHVARRI